MPCASHTAIRRAQWSLVRQLWIQTFPCHCYHPPQQYNLYIRAPSISTRWSRIKHKLNFISLPSVYEAKYTIRFTCSSTDAAPWYAEPSTSGIIFDVVSYIPLSSPANSWFKIWPALTLDARCFCPLFWPIVNRNSRKILIRWCFEWLHDVQIWGPAALYVVHVELKGWMVVLVGLRDHQYSASTRCEGSLAMRSERR